MVSASSSAVTSASVRIRHCCTTFACSLVPETSPTTVWVLRTSMASSTTRKPSSRRDQLAGVGGNECRIAAEVDRVVAGVDENNPGLIAAGLGVLHLGIGDQDHQVAGMHEMRCCAVDSDHTAAALTGDRVRDQP